MALDIKVVHNKVNNIQCLQCEYTKFYNFNLNLHVNSHHLEKQFVIEPCTHCQMMTYSLLHHIKMYHKKTRRGWPLKKKREKKWHVTRDTWYVTHNTWHVTHGGRWTFCKNVRSLAQTEGWVKILRKWRS